MRPSRVARVAKAPVRGDAQKVRSYSSIDGIDGDDWDKLSVEEIDAWTAMGKPPTPLLDTVNYPVHLKNFNQGQLRQLCKELRADIVNTVSQTGGHLSSSLGVVELTVAMHYVFNAPEDKIIWDVGHQAYVHKILTGRRSKMSTIRTTNGLSGTRGKDRIERYSVGDLPVLLCCCQVLCPVGARARMMLLSCVVNILRTGIPWQGFVWALWARH